MSQHRTQYVGNFVCPCDDGDILPTVLATVGAVAPLLRFLISFISFLNIILPGIGDSPRLTILTLPTGLIRDMVLYAVAVLIMLIGVLIIWHLKWLKELLTAV